MENYFIFLARVQLRRKFGSFNKVGSVYFIQPTETCICVHKETCVQGTFTYKCPNFIKLFIII